MILEGSMSLRALGDDEYDDGEVIPVSLESPVVQALINEPWLNMCDNRREYWLSELRSLRIRFAGTIISRVRRQVELTLIYKDRIGGHGHQISFCITLADFDRFL